MKPSVKYEELVDIDKIIAMYKVIRANTKNRGKLHKFELFYSSNIISILNVLKYKKYEHSHYNVFLVHEPKYRIIMSEIMSDKVVNHLVSHYVLDPGITPHLIPQNVATRKGMGTKEGIRYVKKYINKLKLNYDKVYVLKCDIKKYFYSIDHELILQKISRFITDPDVYNLIKNIIESTDNKYVNESIKKVINKEIKRIEGLNILDKENKIAELKSIPLYEKGKGLPIGNMTSQLLAIYFLNDLDHYIKENLKIKHYIRYMDDLVLFHSNKLYLKECLKKIIIFLNNYDLELNNKTVITKNNLCFLGYHFYNKKIKILSKNKRRIYKKLRILKKYNLEKYNKVLSSYYGYFKIQKY